MIDTGTKVTVSPVLSSGSTTPNLSSGTVQSKSLVQTQQHPMLSFASPPVMDFSHLYEQQPSMQQQLFQMHLQQQQQLANQQQQQQLANQQQQQQQLANQQQQHQQGVVATNNVQQHVGPAPQQQSVSLQQPQQLSKGSPTQSTADGLSGHMHHPMGYNMLPSMSNMSHVDNAIANPYFHPGFHQPMQSGMVPMYGLPNPAMPSMMQQHQFQQWQLQQMQQMKSLASVPPHGYPSSLGLKRSMAEAGIVPKPLKQKMRKKKICKNPTCNTFAKGGGFCIRHGGGKRCAVAGCERLARFAGSLCYSHGITKKKYSTLSNESPAATTTTETTTSVEAPEQKVKPQQATNQDEEKTNEEQTAESNKEAATEQEIENSSTKSDEASTTTQVKLATTSEEANRDSSS